MKKLKEKREKLRRLAKKVKGLTEEQKAEVISRTSIATCDGHPLSVFNTIFLCFQSEKTPTIVGGFRQWKRNGRIVRKGEHSIGSIFVPIGTKVKDKNGDEEVVDDMVRFISVSVFDITQTEELNGKGS